MSPAHPALLSELQFQDEPQEDWDKGRNSGFSQLHLKGTETETSQSWLREVGTHPARSGVWFPVQTQTLGAVTPEVTPELFCWLGQGHLP